ncbi:MAG: Hsp33 family molecular chaperone HslO, partial [Erysipelotrichaceae bacterium]|nr:Hsp33 family molecular chaperone HslO [Erysipelotrichaceae bacterium]
MKNNVLIATARKGHVRVSILNAREIVEKARTLHDLWPTSCAALGRTLAVTALMALRQKDDEEIVTVTINGNGPLGTILCVGQHNGQVKGFCGDPHIYETYPNTHKLAVGKAVGTDGYLKVTKNLKLKQNYTS